MCQAGFAATDCSIDLAAPPVVTGIARDGQCDVETRECVAIPIYGTNFLDGKNLTCKITVTKVCVCCKKMSKHDNESVMHDYIITLIKMTGYPNHHTLPIII